MMRTILVTILALAAVSANAAVFQKNIDLSSGIVFPSNNSAIFENPAVLGSFNAQSLDVAGQKSGDTGLLASYSRSSAGFGFGVGFSQLSGNSDIAAGFGWGIGILELGLAGNYDLDAKDFTLDAGLRAMMGAVYLGFVFENVTHFDNRWTGALGWEISRNFLAEADFTFQHGSDLTSLNWIRGKAGVTWNAPQSFSAHVGVPYDVYPSAKFHLDDPELGLSIWLSQRFGVYGLYHPTGADYVAGIKIQ